MGDRIISNRVGTYLNMLDKVQKAAARAILQVYHTIPTATLYRQTGLNPAELTLKHLSRRAVMRTRRLDTSYPLFIKYYKLAFRPLDTRLSRAIKNVPLSEKIDPHSIPLWERFGTSNTLSLATLV